MREPVAAPPATGTPPRLRRTTGWRIRAGAADSIEGYADATSVLAGASVTLFVSTRASTFVVRAFRMGWYGGSEARQIWRSSPVPGRLQRAPVRRPAATNTMTTLWQPSLRVSTRGWPSGAYLLRLDAADGAQSYVPLTVRRRSAAGTLVIISPVTTWQAYNTWGCCDLYAGADGSFATRSRAVSFDRPYLMEHGAGEFIHGELGVVAEAERLRLPVDYVTDVDLQTVPHLLDGAVAVVSPGHDEYWSVPMRSALAAGRGAGTNLAFLGANAIFRRIRFAPTAVGPDRLEINYKVAEEDPLYGRDNAVVTADWPAAPDPRPESALLGAQYGCLLPDGHAPGVVADADSWFFAGTRVRDGEQLPGLIGPEVDAVQPAYPTPRPIQVVLHSPVDCPSGAPPAADATYYVARSGAGIFDAGTIAWACAVGPRCSAPISGPTHRVVRQVTDNVLTAFARGPAGGVHPAQDDLSTLRPAPR